MFFNVEKYIWSILKKSKNIDGIFDKPVLKNSMVK